MEHECRVRTFLKDFNEKIQSPTSEDALPTRICSYSLDPEDVFGQVVDWVLNYLDNRKCPYPLAVSIAKEIASQISASYSEVNTAGENFETSLNSTNIYTDAISKLPAVCSSFLEKDNLDFLCSSKYATSVFAIKNKRRKMEDKYVILHDLNSLLDFKDAPFQSYFAVFDGHSGIDAAAYASAQLHFNIARHPDFFSDTQKAIIEGFRITDEKFLKKCNKENIKSGCTAVAALIRENTIYLSWLGDSQAVLVKGGKAEPLTNPHKPDREDERHRIEGLGGCVSNLMGTLRVNNLLAVSRAIGDPDQKKFITSEAEVTIINLDGTEDFLILACDGLWDGMSPEDVSIVLYRYLKESSLDEPFDAIAAKLVHQSKLQGSEDNITTIVVFLRDVKDIIKDSEKFMTNSFLAQSTDFLSMNGNMKSCDEEFGSETHVLKPTILELNSTSSKKLKNTANVLSSTGLECSSYNYQYVEKMDDSFQNIEHLASSSSQSTFAEQNVAAACFAPEATALSELPTPPIDDILASQQSESFYSTDLYKEMSATHSVDVEVENEQVILNPFESLQTQNSDFTQSVDECIPSMDNVLQDKFLDLATHQITNDAISPIDAVAVASTVVSNTVETAVKQLSAIETNVPIHSSLNPYAKPFIMKSFVNDDQNLSSAETEQENTPIILDNKEISTELKSNLVIDSMTDQEVIENVPSNIPEQNFDSDFVTKTSETSASEMSEQLINVRENDTPKEVVDQNFNSDFVIKTSETSMTEISEQLINMSENDTPKEVIDQNFNPDFVIKSSETSVNEISEQLINMSENDTPKEVFDSMTIIDQYSDQTVAAVASEQVLNQPSLNVHSDHEIKNVNDELKSFNLPSNVENSTKSNYVEKESPETNATRNDMSNENMLNIETSPLEDISLKVSEDAVDKHDLMSHTPIVQQTDLSPDHEKQENVNLNSHVLQDTKSNEQEYSTTVSDTTISSAELLTPETRNPDLDAAFVLTPENDKEKNEKESKPEVKENTIITSEEEMSNVTKSSFLLESITKDSLSLINIQNELNTPDVELPSDHTIEDSKIETVAVDLKSLPEEIPEAEGVTEDVDSDSEKDGGWSYMKGNTVSGSKPKTDKKAQKMPEVKSSTTPKPKKDLTKPGLDLKTAKTKITLADKCKILGDKPKNALVEKPKTTAVSDKLKTTTSVEKNKRLPEKKTDIKEKPKLFKSTATATSVKVTVDKTSKIASNAKKDGTETTTKATTASTAINKPTRPTTLAKSLANKPISSSVGNKNVVIKSNAKLTSSAIVKPKSNTNLTENKQNEKNSSTIAKGQSSNTRPTSTTTTVRNTTRPISSTLTTKTTTLTKTTTIQKSAPSETKPKPPVSSLRKPPSATVKKTDVKEEKDNVNKQISAKTSGSSKVAPSTSFASKKVINKPLSSSSKQDLGKKDGPKTSAYKSITRKVGAKPTGNIIKGKEKLATSNPNKTEQEKNVINVEIDQKNTLESEQKIIPELLQAADEKFILESDDKEIIEKETCESTKESCEILENGGLPDVTPVEVSTPATECVSENL